jgi:ureidoacrylate peracid hydrolase
MDFAVVPGRTALISVDLQNGFVNRAEEGQAIVERVNRLAAACRGAGILVIHTRHVLRRDGSNMGVLGQVPRIRDGLLAEGSESAALHAAVVVKPHDVILDKPRFGAFHGTDLELILRSHGIDTVIVAGISTPVCCDTTAREAHARDFRVLFLSDGTATSGTSAADADRLRSSTLEVLEGLFAQVLTVDEVVRKIDQAASASASDRGKSGA